MYTNELLQEKYKVQKLLSSKARDRNSYFSMIEELARDIYKQNHVRLVFAKRRGGYVGHNPGQASPAGNR